MLRMRALLATLLAFALFGLASAQMPGDKVYTPPDGEWGEDMCILMGIGFFKAGQATERLSPEPAFKPAFSPNQYNYDLDCTAQKVGGSFTIQPLMADAGSSGEITFNGVKRNFRVPDGTGISNTGKAPGSPRKWSFDFQWVKGVNTIDIGVGCNGEGKPYPCYYNYKMKCTVGGGGGGVTGDPQFVGLRGQSYQVHGVAGEIYNIVSDPELQYNSRFVFLTQGACPIVDGVKQKACWSHPGSFLGELGLKTRAGDKIHLISGSADDGFQSVSVNGKELAVGTTVLLEGDLGSVSRNSTHLAQVLVGNWDFAFENSDMFVNQRVRVLDARKLASHGLLGQTWRTATYPNAVKYIQGAVDDYVIRDKDIFGDAFLYNQFD